MSRGPLRDTNQSPFSSGTPHFFKIILEETLQENKLQIPQKFIRNYGETLSDSAFVKLPCGSKWKMKLIKHDNNIWLEKGWPDFAKHYSIKRGSMISFRYEGSSEFNAVIFDTSTVEIDYPSIPVHFDKSDIDLELQTPKEVVVEDDIVEILDGLSPCSEAREKSSLPCSQSNKKKRTSPTALEGGTILERSLTSTEKARILERVPFESEKPFFKLLMQPTYVGYRADYLRVPAGFAFRYIKKQGDVVLSVHDGGYWSVRLEKKLLRCGERIVKLCNGWNKFANDNNLEVGDVCIFELLDGTEISFQVSIVRFNQYECLPWSQAYDGGTIQVEPEEILKNKTQSSGTINDETGKPNSLNYFPPEQGCGCMSTPWKRTSILDRVPFKSEKPFFKVLMRPTYLGSKGNHLHVPLNFAMRYIKTQGDVVLSVPNGKYWSAKFKIDISSRGKPMARFYGGWKEFANCYNLEVDDVCIFELLDETVISFQVSIVRSAEYECLQCSQAHKGGYMSTPHKKSQRLMSDTERARILESIPFESEKPFFKAVMQPSYVGSKATHLHVPFDFAMRYIKKQCEVILSVPNCRSWFVEFRMSPPKVKKWSAGLAKGWPEFANDNNLEVGDICIFKLLHGIEISFEVSIVRVAEYKSPQWSQASNYATTASKPKGAVKVKIELD